VKSHAADPTLERPTFAQLDYLYLPSSDIARNLTFFTGLNLLLDGLERLGLAR
jgi:hypothetical protein